jgi:hypothetical protein
MPKQQEEVRIPLEIAKDLYLATQAFLAFCETKDWKLSSKRLKTVDLPILRKAIRSDSSKEE